MGVVVGGECLGLLQQNGEKKKRLRMIKWYSFPCVILGNQVIMNFKASLYSFFFHVKFPRIRFSITNDGWSKKTMHPRKNRKSAYVHVRARPILVRTYTYVFPDSHLKPTTQQRLTASSLGNKRPRENVWTERGEHKKKKNGANLLLLLLLLLSLLI